MKNFLLKFLPLAWLEKHMLEKLRHPSDVLKELAKANPDHLEMIGRRKAIKMFEEAATRVPQYRDFLKHHKVDHKKIRTFEDFLGKVPFMDKPSYISKATHLANLLMDGDISKANLLIGSSGHSGHPTVWARCDAELEKAKLSATLGLHMVSGINFKKTFVINALALGSWVGGMTFSRIIASPHVTLINTGPNIEEILRLIGDFGEKYEQVLIAGYPPFLKNLVHQGVEKGLKWKKYHVCFLCGGEGFSEGWRDYMLTHIGGTAVGNHTQRIVGAFGASDLGITGFNETQDTIQIRRYAMKNKGFFRALFGETTREPMLFQYNPTQFHVMQSPEGELVFTTLDGITIEPLIKYNIHDVGGVIPFRKMGELIKKFKIPCALDYSLPFIYVTGRSDGSIKVNGTFLFPENIKQALYSDPGIAHETSGKFKMTVEEKGSVKHFVIEIELAPNVTLKPGQEEDWASKIQKHLTEHNANYARVSKVEPEASKVHVKAWPNGQFPTSAKLKLDYV